MTSFHMTSSRTLPSPTPMSPSTITESNPEPPRFLSREAYQALIAEIRGLSSQWGITNVSLESGWRSDVRWTRNRLSTSGEWRDTEVTVRRYNAGAQGGSATTNQIDTDSLTGLVHWAEHTWQLFDGRGRDVKGLARQGRHGTSYAYVFDDHRVYPKTHIWSDDTYAQTQDTRVEIATRLITGAEAAGMLSAGYLGVEARGVIYVLPDESVLYAPLTRVQYSLTVRDPEGTGSGWAGRSSYDWGRLDAERLAATALEKCVQSRNPVSIEPGRYTVVLEPQATFDFLNAFHNELFFRLPPNIQNATWPFHDPKTKTIRVSAWATNPVVIASTKVGQRVVDARLNWRYDPEDPDLGLPPFDINSFSPGYPMTAVQLLKNGVLMELEYDAGMRRAQMMDLAADLDPRGRACSPSFRIDGGPTATATIPDLIATTTRGLLVTRFSNVAPVRGAETTLFRGTTRDGLWLIERGKISKPVRNMSFTESAMVALNNIDEIGVAVPIFNPDAPAVTPSLKIRDFSFTAVSGAL